MRLELGKLSFRPSSERVLSVIRVYASSYISIHGYNYRLKLIEDEINSQYNTKINIKQVLNKMINYMIVYTVQSKYYVEIPNVKVNDISLDTLARLITFGNLKVKGDPIIVDALKYARDKL